MISLNSLSQELLPKTYVKKITLDTNYKQKTVSSKGNSGYYDESPQTVLIPGNSSTSKLILSAKILKNSNIKSELSLLLDSELSQFVKIYVHQITNKDFYETLVAGATKEILTTDNTGINQDVQTKILNLIGDVKYQFGGDVIETTQVDSNTIQLPEQILDDGTILNELISEVDFEFRQDVDFLAYIVVTAIQHESIDEVFISDPSREIVILDNALQNEGVVFTLAQYPPDKVNEFTGKFGKSGDVWAGGVHVHENKFMAGGVHTPNEAHPFLDYTIVPMSKYVDNRVKDKIKRNIVNITKSFEILNSLTSRFQSSKNILDFSETKNKTYISDIYLSQDKEMNVNGAFVVDKLEILKNLSAYSFLFKNAKQVLSAAKYKAFVNDMSQRAVLDKLLIYEGNKLLGQITETEDFASFDLSNSESVKINKNNFDVPVTDNTDGLQYFSFKHFSPSGNSADIKYRVEVEYKDPTIDYVIDLVVGLTPAIETVDKIISFASNDKKSGFDSTTEKLKSSVIGKILSKQSPYDEVDTVKINNGYAVISSIYSYFVSNQTNISTFFYSPDVSMNDFTNYFLKLSNLFTTTLSDLLILQSFLIDLKSKLLQTLNSFGSNPIKSDNPQFYGQIKNQGNVNASLGKKVIKVLGRDSKISIKDHGYDFLGYLDKNFQDGSFTLEGIAGRRKNNFTEVLVSDYNKSCLFLFSKIISPNFIPEPLTQESLNIVLQNSFKPKGLDTMTPEASVYSYLSLPIKFIKSCVMLPSTVLDYSFFNESTPIESIAQRVFTSVLRLKNDITVENSVGNDQNSTQEKKQNFALQKDNVSFLKKSGFNIPNLTKFNLSDEETESSENLNESKADNDTGIQSIISPAITNLVGNSFLPKLDLQIFTTADNFIILSIANRKIFKSTTSFKLNMSKEDFVPYNLGFLGNLTFFFAHFVGGLATLPPLQVLSLSIDGDSTSPFRNYSTSDQTYIKNGVINPFLLSFFWFKHQNIVRVEYLSDFETSQQTVHLKDKSNPYEQGLQKTITNRNVNKPVWKTVNKQFLDNLADPSSSVKKVLCRLVRYNYSYYINKKLVREANLPLIDNYFILSQQTGDAGDDTINPQQAAGQTQINLGPEQITIEDPSNLQAPSGPLPDLLPGGGI